MNIAQKSFYFLICITATLGLHAQISATSSTDSNIGDKSAVELDRVVVTTGLDKARQDLVPSLGATEFQIDSSQIEAVAQGANASFNQILLRVPGIAQDSFNQVHIRGEHANLQYRINDVLLPEGISGFGQELDTRFVDSLSVLTGSLPAQYGYRTSGIVDIHTKNGGQARGGDASIYAGSFDTFRPSFDANGSVGAMDYYVTAGFLSNAQGIENPTDSRRAIHDRTKQAKAFGYFSYVIDSQSRLSVFLSGSRSDFEIPNNPGQSPQYTLAGVGRADSAKLDERQREINGYLIAAYQKTLSNGGFQVSAYTRSSEIKFSPDSVGDLIFNGVASTARRAIVSDGVEANANWAVADAHTIRAGFIASASRAANTNTTAVFTVDGNGNQSSITPVSIRENQTKGGALLGLYVQDEWKAASSTTVNYGARLDRVDAFLKESQLSPRLNVVYTPAEGTGLHAGYARYFTPPPLELIRTDDLAKFTGTTNAPEVTESSPVRSERAHYFDLGVTHRLSGTINLGLDGYYKKATSQLDEGQFGQAIVFSPFNYGSANVYGLELSGNYTKAAFSAYSNIAFSRATGRRIVSGQFLFGRDELDYIATHDVHLDHDQQYTASAGASYKMGRSLVYGDILYGSGLRRGFANTEKLPSYATANLGYEYRFLFDHKKALKLRLDVVNLADKVYELRDGSGIGVGAPQFGSSRAVYGTISWDF